MPPQHNPYAQPSPGAPAGPYGAPQPPYYGPPQQPGAAPAGGPRGGAGRAVLWAVVGAVVASAAWAGGVLVLGKDSGKADLRGYTSKRNLCDSSDLTAFKTTYPKPDKSPTSYTSDRPSMVQMYCSESLDKEDSSSSDTSYSYSYVSIEADLHRKSDPGPEFGDHWKSFEDHGSAPDDKYTTTAVDGFGDEAYLVTQDTVISAGEGESGSRQVVLAVRDGWMTFTLSWNGYASSLDETDDKIPTVERATDWVKAATKATMPKLK
ncbi:hypothetical protein [Streptomyces sp. NBC_01198]|uniref:hypothetical protein n=1 Tax=Streptomyces sp. NBC_01198 TaxID=2903769 RepID=UPI002E143086|nr:hypothetical protein OG702_25025 [Streptomyces sp. NBC_01198]